MPSVLQKSVSYGVIVGKGDGKEYLSYCSKLTVSIFDNFSYCMQVVGVSESKRSLRKLVKAIKVFTLICRSLNLNSVQKRGHN